MTASDPSNGGGERVSYTTKELVSRIDNRLEEIVAEIHKKADKATVTELSARLAEVSTRVDAGMNLNFTSGPIAELLTEFRNMQKAVGEHQTYIDSERAEKSWRSGFRRWAVPVGLSLIGIGLQFAFFLHAMNQTP